MVPPVAYVAMHVHVSMSGLAQLSGTKCKWHGADMSMADNATFLAGCSDCTGGTTSSKLVDGSVAIWKVPC